MPLESRVDAYFLRSTIEPGGKPAIWRSAAVPDVAEVVFMPSGVLPDREYVFLYCFFLSKLSFPGGVLLPAVFFS